MMLKERAGILVLFHFLPGFFLPAFLPQGFAQEAALVIEGGTLIDGTGREPMKDAAIVIQGNRIQRVGRKGAIPYPAHARIIRAEGKTILPGLIDMHVHYDGWMPELFLAHGVTSVADLSSRDWTFAQRDGIAKGKISGPRIFTSNMTFVGRLVPEAPPSGPLLLRRPEDPQMAQEVARKYVRGFIGRKINLVKAYTEITSEELKALIDEADQAGIRVIGHLASLDASQAAQLGIDGLAHASGVALATIRDPGKVKELREFQTFGISVDYPHYLMYHAFMDPGKARELIGLLVQKNVHLEPDLINIARWAARRRKEYEAEDIRLLKNPKLQYLPENIRQRLTHWAPWEDLKPEEMGVLQKGYENLGEFIRDFVKAGGKVLAGTDTASFVIPGISLHRELELLVESELTPLQAIVAATGNNAEFLGQGGQLGTIRVGSLADMIIVRGDPLRDIRSTQEVEVVIQDGRILDTAYHAGYVNPIPRPPREPIAHPIPSIHSISPQTLAEGDTQVTLRIEGKNFLRKSLVTVDGVKVAVTPVASSQVPGTAYLPHFTQLEATLPPRLSASVGILPVQVVNPPPEGGSSNIVYLIVQFK